MPLPPIKSNLYVRTFISSMRGAFRAQMIIWPWIFLMGVLLVTDPLAAFGDRNFDLLESSRSAGRVVSVHSFGTAFSKHTVVETDTGFFAVDAPMTIAKGQTLTLVQHEKSFRLCTEDLKSCMRLRGTQLVERVTLTHGSAPEKKQ
jgi:hypothetical protein